MHYERMARHKGSEDFIFYAYLYFIVNCGVSVARVGKFKFQVNLKLRFGDMTHRRLDPRWHQSGY